MASRIGMVRASEHSGIAMHAVSLNREHLRSKRPRPGDFGGMAEQLPYSRSPAGFRRLPTQLMDPPEGTEFRAHASKAARLNPEAALP
jgi:hypothetical protein